MSVLFRIPKKTDREIVAGLIKVCAGLKDFYAFQVGVSIPVGGRIILEQNESENSERIAFLLSEESQLATNIDLVGPESVTILQVVRKGDSITDEVILPNGWNGHLQVLKNRIPAFYAKMVSLARKELCALDIETSALGQSDNDWNSFRAAQASVLESLQKTNESVLEKAAENSLKLEEERSKRFGEMETKLRSQIEEERRAHQAELAKKQAELEVQEKVLADKLAGFETKEARYVARQNQSEQLKQIQGWLDEWSLTKGTSQKRWPIVSAYVIAMGVLGWMTVYATYHNYDLLKSSDDIAKLVWWQWLAISAKSILPLAGFTTFMIYFIRWSSAWARQHAEEEFRNRTRLVDIGRSSWLLEAVRDAQENDKEIPEELLRQLSQNLFSNSISGEPDIHPQAITDLLSQGLSSIRVKSPDGAEVEASRNRK